MKKIFDSQALIRARARARLTQEALGNMVGITNRQIFRYEKGKAEPRETTAILLADALGVEPDDLYKEEATE